MAKKNTIPIEEIEKAYHLAKKVYNKEMRQVDAVAELNMNDSSAKYYIGNYKQMREGKCYQRTMNPFASEYYLQNILNDFGYEGLSKALSSMQQHLYYKSNLKKNASPQHKIRKIYEEYKIILDGTKKESHLIEDINKVQSDKTIDITYKETLIQARIGQGKFRDDVIEIANGLCKVTKINQIEFLIASHIKPWRYCKNYERLDGNNGLLLSPHIDKLFDKGYLTFKDNGDILISDSVDRNIIKAWNITQKNVGKFSPEQQKYLKFHRGNIFKEKQFGGTFGGML